MPSLAVAGGLSALGYLRGRFQHRQTFLPDRYPNGVWDPRPFGLPATDLWFEADDGVRLHGWWIPHRKARGTVLYFHGNTGSIAHQLGTFRHLRRLRANILGFDYRGYGRSEGDPSERGLYRDARAAYRVLVEELGQDPGEVLFFGHSLGGAVAIDAALDCPAAGLIVQASFTNARDMARALFPTLPMGLMTVNQFRSVDKVPELGLPKLFIHGTEDGSVPHEQGVRLYEAAAEPKELYLVPRAGHNDLHHHGGVRYLWRIGRFKRRCVRRSPRRIPA